MKESPEKKSKILSRGRQKQINNPSFIVHIKPLDNELLTSWLTRTAFAHNMQATTFLNIYIINGRNFLARRDLDFYNDDDFFKVLYSKTIFIQDEILSMSIRSEEGFLYNCNNCLVVPHQIRKPIYKRSNYGMMFCPKCLSEDKIPYWRKKWRYDFYTACPKHKIFLSDRCGSCYERIRVTKMNVSDKVVFCSKCGRDLSITRPAKVPEECLIGLDAIKWFEKALEQGYFTIGNDKIWSVLFFQVYNRFKLLLDRKEDLILREFEMLDKYQQLCKKLENYDSKKGAPVYKNFFLNAMVYHLFQDFPKNFVNFVKDNNFTYRDFMHALKNVPFWYKEMIEEHVPKQDTVGREITKEEVLGVIKYLKSQNKKVTQMEVARIIDCHFSKNKGFMKIYKSIKM
ncbi:MAG: TniQ family protein [Arcobacteraceae bacterium]|nr:TniQ family protein [Arcobacteraceae bacterium]